MAHMIWGPAYESYDMILMISHEMNWKLELAKSVWLQVEPNRLQNKRNAREKFRINPGLKFNETRVVTRVMIVTDSFCHQHPLLTSTRSSLALHSKIICSTFISFNLCTIIHSNKSVIFSSLISTSKIDLLQEVVSQLYSNLLVANRITIKTKARKMTHSTNIMKL